MKIHIKGLTIAAIFLLFKVAGSKVFSPKPVKGAVPEPIKASTPYKPTFKPKVKIFITIFKDYDLTSY